MSNYHLADTEAQWFADNFPGSQMNLSAATAVLVLHTTEGTSWPGYSGGASAPHYTALPDIVNKRLTWRAHFPDEMSSRALRNEDGGVETNTLNCVQLELIGTCDPKHQVSWNGDGERLAGVDYLFWPDAPSWALLAVARFLADQHRRHGLALRSLRFDAYPASISSVRMTGDQWRKYVGVCGHQHVPENTHGDPGDIDIIKLLAFAQEFVDPSIRLTLGVSNPAAHLSFTHGERPEIAVHKTIPVTGSGSLPKIEWKTITWRKNKYVVINWIEPKTLTNRVRTIRRVRRLIHEQQAAGFGAIVASNSSWGRWAYRREGLRWVSSIFGKIAYPLGLEVDRRWTTNEALNVDLEKA